MPTAPLRYCLEPSCSALVRQGRCAPHTKQVTQHRAQDNGHRWYHTSRWKALRERIRYQEEPFCRQCGQLSDVVDHIEPHQGDEQKFWDRKNLQSMCSACHGAKTRAGQ